METIGQLVAPLAGLVALVAMVLETLAHRKASSFPLTAVLATRFPFPVPSGTPMASAACAGAAAVLIPLMLCAAAGRLSLAIARPTSQWVLLALVTVLVKTLWVVIEEVIFRGALLSQIAARTGTVVAVIVSAVVFAGAHSSRAAVPNLLSLAVYVLDGLIFGVLAVRTAALWAPAAWHLSKNLVIWVLGWGGTLQLVSGPLAAHIDGPVLWMGTAHQAGLLDLLVTTLLLGGVLALTRPRQTLPRSDPSH